MIYENGGTGLADNVIYELKETGADLVTENKYNWDSSVKQHNYELISPEGIHFLYYQGEAVGRNQIFLNSATSFVQLNFTIYNKSEYRHVLSGTKFAQFNNYEYNLLLVPPGTTKIEWEGDGNVENFFLNILPGIFTRYLPSAHPFIQRFLDASVAQQAMPLSEYNLPVTPQIRTILNDILNCPLDRHYKKLYLKAKVIELLLFVSSHFEEYSEVKSDISFGLQDADVERMQQAREILQQNIQNPCSLIDLAHQVGTNDNYLKKHFKQVFGQTVYGYVQQMRMHEAKRMLLNTDVSISEVASLVGYKHTHHFIAAYKKFFGYAPIKK